MKWCLTCGTPCTGPRCTPCRNTYKRNLYPPTHTNTRKQWAPTVNRGNTQCPRCNQPIQPGQPWDLGHHTNHPEHATCNRAAGGRHTDHT